jgi:hypothetical protein
MASGATIGFDLVFTCTSGCTTGVDAPTGMFTMDDAVLGVDALEVAVQSVTVSFMSIEWTFPPGATDDFSKRAPTVDVVNGIVENFRWSSNDSESRNSFKSTSDEWITSERLGVNGDPKGFVQAVSVQPGSVEPTPKATPAMPEPSAITLFALGGLLTAASVRRSSRG